MCVICRASNSRNKYAIGLMDCGHSVTHRLHVFTGERIPVGRWVNQIHADDWDWYERHWAWEDEFDYRLMVAGVTDGQSLAA